MNKLQLRRTLLTVMIGAAISPVCAYAYSDAPHVDISVANKNSDQSPQSQDQSKIQNKAAAKSERNEQEKRNETNLNAVIVTASLRSSLQSAQSIKQNSRMIVDSIVAEDIGKLPDNSVADALQRVTGVQVAQGFQGETNSVVIRGLPNVETTLNGRQIFGSGGRGFAFQDLPATMVRALKVYKTADASMITGGIAGTVDFVTYRPFDFPGSKVAATLTETHQKYGGHTDPTASLLLSDRWETGIGEVGALVNMGITEMHYDYNVAFADDNLTSVLTDGKGNVVHDSDGNLVVGTNSYGANYNFGSRKRPAGSYALQWKPNDRTEVFLEGLFTWDHDRYAQPFYGFLPENNVPVTNITTSDNCFPVGLSGSPYEGQTICPLTSARYSGNFYAFTSTQAHQQWGHNNQNSLGLKWNGDRLNLSTELTRTSASFENDNFIIDTYLDAFHSPLTLDYNYPSTFKLEGNPQLDPNRYYLANLDDSWNNNKAKETAWRGDGTFYVGGGFVNSIDFGLRYSRTDATASGGHINQPPPGGAYLPDGAPNPTNNVADLFGSDYLCNIPTDSSVPDGALTGCYDYLVNNKGALREYYGRPPGKVSAQKDHRFDIAEKTYSAYAQINYANSLFGIPFDGVIGIRAENVKRNLNASALDAVTGEFSPISISTDKNHWLPNATFNLHFTDDLQMRLSAGRTITYPSFGDLNPSLTLVPGTINTIATGSGGNAHLKPMKSNSYDASLEWYFNKVGSLTGDVFYRDITGYIERLTFQQEIGGVNYLISGPESAGSGHLQGAEIAYQQFFSFLPGAWSGLGLQANYTYIDGSLKTQAINGTGFISTPFQNVSKNNYNLVLMYEKYGISARLAYNYRSSFPEFFLAASNVIGNNALMYDHPANMLDFSISYEINRHVSVLLNATNLNHAHFQSFAGTGRTLPQDYRYQDRSVGLGVRLKF